MKNKMYYDCEFLEGTQERPLILKSRLGHWMIGKQKPTIDLISIGIVSGDDDREYYAISKDFNIKEAWNRYDEKVEVMYGDMRNRFPEGRKYKEYWIRENVLFPIYYELCLKDNSISVHEYGNYNNFVGAIKSSNNYKYVYKNLKRLIAKYGKSNKQIAEEIIDFVKNSPIKTIGTQTVQLTAQSQKNMRQGYVDIDLYGYYSAYDHVCLMWLWGKMIDRPKGFPMFTIDLKQMFDEKANKMSSMELTKVYCPECTHNMYSYLEGRNEFNKITALKKHPNYPKETNSHNALADARWNKQLHQFIKSL